MSYVVITLLCFYLLIMFNISRNLNFDINCMNLVMISRNLFIYNAIYNSNTRSIYIYGFANSSIVNIYPCKIFFATNWMNCIVKYNEVTKHFFMYELWYNSFNSPKLITINNKAIYIQKGITFNKNNTVCITRMVNYSAAYHFVQLIETYMVFGFTRFIVYYTSSSSDIYRILNYYQLKNYMTIIKWSYDYETTIMKEFGYGQLWKYNDCFYRNAGNEGLLTFTDLDEIIWPVENIRISNVLTKLDKKESDVYIFRSRIFMKKYTNQTYDRFSNDVEDFNLFNLHKSCIYPRNFISKYIINNGSYIKTVHIHNIETSIKPIKKVYVPYKYMFVRHSRRVRKDLFEKCKIWVNSTDSIILIKTIENKVKRSIKSINYIINSKIKNIPIDKYII